LNGNYALCLQNAGINDPFHPQEREIGRRRDSARYAISRVMSARCFILTQSPRVILATFERGGGRLKTPAAIFHSAVITIYSWPEQKGSQTGKCALARARPRVLELIHFYEADSFSLAFSRPVVSSSLSLFSSRAPFFSRRKSRGNEFISNACRRA